MTRRPKPSGMLLPMRVWDGWIRLFHWAIVLGVAVSYVSISIADGPRAGLWMRVHVISGEAMMGLLVFRLIWGFVGSDTARFTRFVRSPLAALHHLAHIGRREPDTQIGHNAAGGWMVLILLGVLAGQVGTGLFANDDGATEGPLAQFVSKALSDRLSGWHGVVFNGLVALVVLHVLAVVFYAVVKHQNLLRPIITGKKRLPAATPAPRMASPILAAVTLAVAAGVTVLVARL